LEQMRPQPTATETAANSRDEARRTEAGSQQTHRMEVLKPLAVGDLGLPAGNILYVLRVDEIHL